MREGRGEEGPRDHTRHAGRQSCCRRWRRSTFSAAAAKTSGPGAGNVAAALQPFRRAPELRFCGGPSSPQFISSSQSWGWRGQCQQQRRPRGGSILPAPPPSAAASGSSLRRKARRRRAMPSGAINSRGRRADASWPGVRSIYMYTPCAAPVLCQGQQCHRPSPLLLFQLPCQLGTRPRSGQPAPIMVAFRLRYSDFGPANRSSDQPLAIRAQQPGREHEGGRILGGRRGSAGKFGR